MKITLTQYDNTFSVDTSNESTVGEVVETFRGLLVAAGYHPNIVDSCFNLDNKWYPEDEETDFTDVDPEGSTRDQISKAREKDFALKYDDVEPEMKREYDEPTNY